MTLAGDGSRCQPTEGGELSGGRPVIAPGTGIAATRRESRRGQSPPEPEPNGYLWPNIVKFNTTKTEVWIEQLSTGEVKYYLLPALPQDSDTLPGVVDKTGFLP